MAGKGNSKDGEMHSAAMQQRLRPILVGFSIERLDENALVALADSVQSNRSFLDLSTLDGQCEVITFTDNADLIIHDNLSTLTRSG